VKLEIYKNEKKENFNTNFHLKDGLTVELTAYEGEMMT